jgi:hypothetical protein
VQIFKEGIKIENLVSITVKINKQSIRKRTLQQEINPCTQTSTEEKILQQNDFSMFAGIKNC